MLDHHTLTAGLAGAGSEHHRREVSRLLASAIDGGPAVAVPGHPPLDWPAAHAVTIAMATASPLITTTPPTYTGIPVDVLDL